mmetsp:Transcript_103019/g.327467  ORF Transcript_103019/g.327467 Transcript_103019/m.327467 type:complete len:315 (+) Transcript_103019:640-1584(+)
MSLALVGRLSSSKTCSIFEVEVTCQTPITGGFDKSLSEALAKRRAPGALSSSKGHQRSAFKMPPWFSVATGGTMEPGFCRAGSACHSMMLLSAAPETNSKSGRMSSAPTAPVWPAKVAWHFSSGFASDQHRTYLSLEQVKRYLLSLETTTPTMGFSCRHINSAFFRSSTSRSSLRCLRLWSSARFFPMSLRIPDGSSSMISTFFEKISVWDGSFTASAVISFTILSLPEIFSSCLDSSSSPLACLSSSFRTSRSFFETLRNSFSSSTNAEDGLKVDCSRHDMMGLPISYHRAGSQWPGPHCRGRTGYLCTPPLP